MTHDLLEMTFTRFVWSGSFYVGAVRLRGSALFIVSANPPDDESSGYITAPDKSGFLGKSDLSGAVM
jgi:hypothetical protein